MAWSGDVGSFVEGCVRERDTASFRDALESVPDEQWRTVQQALTARLDQVVPGEPEPPPLTRGEGRGAEVLSEDQLVEQARALEMKRRALADEDRRRRGGG